MGTVNRATLSQMHSRLGLAIDEADTQKNVPNEAGGVRTVEGCDDWLSQTELRVGAKGLTLADQRLFFSLASGSMLEGHGNTASTVEMQKHLAEAAAKLLAADAEGNDNGIVEWDEVYTSGGNPKRGIGQMAARLFDAAQDLGRYTDELKNAFRRYREAGTPSGEFSAGTVITDRTLLPPSVRKAHRLVQFEFEGAKAYYTQSAPDARGFTHFALFDRAFNKLAQGRQLAAEEGADLLWK